MRRVASLILCGGVLSLAAGGCRPLISPMPARLDNEDQKSINESWEKALVPIDRFDNQALLDLLLTTKAYQIGVDKLEFRSEKSYSGGTVVMEIRYDRLSPERDRFEVKVLNPEGRILRQESYDRKQIDRTEQELSIDFNKLHRKREAKEASPEEIKRLEAYEARLAVVQQIFPKFNEKREKDDKEKKQP